MASMSDASKRLRIVFILWPYKNILCLVSTYNNLFPHSTFNFSGNQFALCELVVIDVAEFSMSLLVLLSSVALMLA